MRKHPVPNCLRSILLRLAVSGEESIERILQMMAGHDLNHLRQIEAILAVKK